MERILRMVTDKNGEDHAEELCPGDVVKHFKRDLLVGELTDPMVYLYRIVGLANHTETDEQFVVYEALYGDKKMYIRPKDMFLSEVDNDKYPDAKQKYRFEKMEEN